MSRIERTTEFFPLVVTRVPAAITLADIEVYERELEKTFERRARFASIVVTTASTKLPGSAERRRLAHWQHSVIELIARYNVFHATVVDSPIARGAMTAMNWLFPPPNEQVVVATFGEAFDLAIARLRSAGVDFPPALEQLARTRPRHVDELLGARPHDLRR